ncbi:hypothetical protein ACE02G_14250 [Shewanella xiamenensis]|uniref:hypothetical protein n=1 Tax=Shewanella xiamenensis TaxID=332186 RepID=UPI0035BABF64
MFAVTVNSNLLGERLDAGFYRPTFLSMEKALREKGAVRLETLVDSVACGPFGGNAIADDLYARDGVAFIRPVNISSHVFDDSSLVRVPKKNLAANGLKIYQGTNIYFGRVGDPCVAIIEGESSISPNIIIACTKGDLADPYYIYSFSTSSFGLQQLKRQLKTVAQPTTSTDAIRELLVFKPENAAQKYIGDKVRQAERLRAWAKLAETQVNQYHKALVPQQSGLDFAKRVRLVSPARMSERLDAHFYPGVVDEYLRLHQGKFKPLGKLCATIYNGQTQPQSESSQSCKQITVTNLSSSFLGGSPRDVEAPGKKEKFLKAYDILMCNAAHNKSYIGKDLTFVHSEAAILPSTEVMTIRVDRNQVPASYVRAYLLTKLGYVQIQSTIRGITAHSYPDDMALLDIYVPDVADKDKEEWFACDEKLALAGIACEVATQLTNAAKLLVEALIEGQLTEAELIAAEQALQAGNDQLDRRVLNRLKTDGIDGQGPALFGDLDELYHLLTQAEGD